MTITATCFNIDWHIWIGILRLGSLAWDLARENFHSEAFAGNVLLKIFTQNNSFESLAWDLSLGTFAWDLSLETCRLGSFAWKLSLRFGSFVLTPALGNSRSRTFDWDLSFGNVRLGGLS